MCFILKTLFSRLQEFDQDIIIGNDTNEDEVRGNVVNETSFFLTEKFPVRELIFKLMQEIFCMK